jgi:hypothetical protein
MPDSGIVALDSAVLLEVTTLLCRLGKQSESRGMTARFWDALFMDVSIRSLLDRTTLSPSTSTRVAAGALAPYAHPAPTP